MENCEGISAIKEAMKYNIYRIGGIKCKTKRQKK